MVQRYTALPVSDRTLYSPSQAHSYHFVFLHKKQKKKNNFFSETVFTFVTNLSKVFISGNDYDSDTIKNERKSEKANTSRYYSIYA